MLWILWLALLHGGANGAGSAAGPEEQEAVERERLEREALEPQGKERGAQDRPAPEDGGEDDEDVPLPLRVNRAIALGVDALRRTQSPDGSFPGHEREHPGGSTAFAAYTLVKSGVRRDDPDLRRALASLANVEFRSVYSASSNLLLCEALRDPGRRESAQRCLDFLIANRTDGVWAYPWGHPCDSNTQFALLALRAARRMGLEVPEQVLVEALEGLRVFRHHGGGFTYSPADRNPAENRPYAGITAAALASLAVLEEASADLPRLRGALQRADEMREEAVEWLEERFDPLRNVLEDGSWMPTWHYAYLWALERWCGLSARERVAGRDWYAEGATWLVETQNRDGSFGAGRLISDTCFALLFLRRATVTEDAELAAIDAEIDRRRAERPDRPRRASDDARRLTDWWLAGPFTGGDEPLLLEPPFDPADAQPKERGKLARKDWERVTLLAQRWTDLERLTRRPGNRQLWALSTTLLVPAERPEPVDVLLWLEVDDGWDVWLDGARVSRERRRVPSVASDVSFPLRLAPGEHRLTVLIEDSRGVSGFGALLSDAQGGAPPEGVRESTDPKVGR